MRKLFKSFIALLMLSGLISGVGFILNSCTKEESVDIPTENGKKYLLSLKDDLEEMCKLELSPNSDNSTRAFYFDSTNVTVSVFIPGQNNTEAKEFIESVKTIGELIAATNDLNASLSVGDNNTYKDHVGTTVAEVHISKSTINQSLSPLVAKSKKFLINRGMTESDIVEMLETEHADETSFISLTLAMAEYEENHFYTMANHPQINQWNILATPTYAWNVDKELVRDCALHAIGVDVFQSILANNTKKWSKVLIKRMFKTIALRTCAPSSAFIVVLSFTACMNGIDWI